MHHPRIRAQNQTFDQVLLPALAKEQDAAHCSSAGAILVHAAQDISLKGQVEAEVSTVMLLLVHQSTM